MGTKKTTPSRSKRGNKLDLTGDPLIDYPKINQLHSEIKKEWIIIKKELLDRKLRKKRWKRGDHSEAKKSVISCIGKLREFHDEISGDSGTRTRYHSILNDLEKSIDELEAENGSQS